MTVSRREFIKKGSLAAAGLMIVPSAVLGKKVGRVAPSDRLNIVGVGVGGRGASVLKEFKDQNIIALCDVDWRYSKKVFDDYPTIPKYKDFRKLFDEMGKKIDAVMVATADHTHAVIAARAIAEGKHVYCEKPLTHTVYETRLLTKLAQKHQVATQMGNQGASGDGVRITCEAIWDGMIGEITKVEAFTDRPIWPQGLPRPVKEEIPHPDMDWDLFLGPAKYRPYNSIYTPWNWRGWWDFGTGALGDMACHILQPVTVALNLNYPISVQGSSTVLLTDCAPNAQRVRYVFPARDNMPKVAMPEVEVIWYDGGLKPDFPKGWPAGKSMNDQGGGVIFHGTKDILICGCYGANPWLISGRQLPKPVATREITDGHYMDFVKACKEPASSRRVTTSDFSIAGPLNEMVVMGVLGVRLQALNKELMWDGANMKFTNILENEQLKIMTEDGFSIHEGHPTFNKKFTEPINAVQLANELIKHNYREGYTLPVMP
jgi:hypothetical protein